MQLRKLYCCIRKDEIKPSPIFVFLCVRSFLGFLFPKTSFYIASVIDYSKVVAGPLCSFVLFLGRNE